MGLATLLISLKKAPIDSPDKIAFTNGALEVFNGKD
jgi:hypothetical protein